MSEIIDVTHDRSGELPGRMSVDEVAQRLSVGRVSVYSMLEQGILPGFRLGRRWIITRHAYIQWERTAGWRVAPGLQPHTEVDVH